MDSSSEAEEMNEDATPRKKMKLMYSKSRRKSPSKGSVIIKLVRFFFSRWKSLLNPHSWILGHENLKVVCQLEDSNEENKTKESLKKLSSENT